MGTRLEGIRIGSVSPFELCTVASRVDGGTERAAGSGDLLGFFAAGASEVF